MLVLVSTALTLGCRATNVEIDPANPLFDGEVVSFDAAAPSLVLSQGGSILLGQGWGRIELTGDPPESFTWALGGHSTIEVPRPVTAGLESGDGEGIEFDFVAELMPFASEAGNPQRLALHLGERRLADTEVEKGWQRIRVPLPAGIFDRAWTTLDLRFARVDKPSDLGSDADSRPLSAAFKDLAIVPRGVPSSTSASWGSRATPSQALRAKLSGASGSSEGSPGRRLDLAGGAAWSVPVPAGRQGSFAAAAAESKCKDCELRIEHRSESPAGLVASLLWQGTAAELDGSRIPIATPDGGLGRLTFSWSAALGRSPLRLSLGEDYLRFDKAEEGAAVAAEAGEKGGSGEGLRHVVFYLVDTLRATDLGPYGSELVTPQVDRFAADSVVYDQAWTASSWTLPATVSVLTGVYPDRHGIMTGQQRFDGGSVPALAERLGKMGYETVGFSQSYVASQRFGMDRGFDSFTLDDQLNGPALRSQRLRRRFLRWLEDPSRDSSKPFFAYLHSVDPHGPYEPVGELRERAEEVGGNLPEEAYHPLTFQLEGHGEDPTELRRLKALYEGEVGYAEMEFGRFVRLLELLELYEPSLVALLSDHGEEFAEHRGYGHGRTLYQEQLQVPLIVKYPHSLWAGTVETTPVSSLDLVPTVLELAGQAPTALLDGRSLVPSKLEEAGPRLLVSQVRPQASDHMAAVDYVALRLGDLKCIHSRGAVDQFGQPVEPWQIFDLAVDPNESQPLPADDPRGERCRRLWQRWQEMRAELPAEDSSSPVDEEALEQLRALGYIGN